MSQDPTLVVFCKRPERGRGKQRLAATLGQTPALALARLFLACALEDARRWRGPVVLSPAKPSDVGWARRLLPPSGTVVPQPCGNLGERLAQVDRTLRAVGHRRLLFMGSDAPMLTAAHFHSARAQLERFPVVLSAADDGGVILMGSSRSWPPLSDLPWSTPRLGEALAEACRERGDRVGFALPGYDIDHAKDLGRLLGDLRQDRRSARVRLARWLAAWQARDPRNRTPVASGE